MAENQYVVFSGGKVEFGIDIKKVTEILIYEEVLKLPETPEYMLGVINYRGSVLPIIDTKIFLGLGNSEVTKNTRIVVAKFNGNDTGFVVDSVSQTLRLDESKIEDTENINIGIKSKYIKGVGKIDDKRILVIIEL